MDDASAANTRWAASRSESGRSANALWLCSRQPDEELPGDIHPVIGVAEDHLASIMRIGFAPHVTGVGHPLYEVGDRRTGQPHLLTKLASSEVSARRLGHHHEEKRAKVVGSHVVITRKGSCNPIRRGRYVAKVRADLLLQRHAFVWWSESLC